MKNLKLIIGIIIVAVIAWLILKPGTPDAEIAEVTTQIGDMAITSGEVMETETVEPNEVDEIEQTLEMTEYSVAQGSSVNWRGEKTGGEHSGIVAISEGLINASEGEIKNGSFTMDMNTIKATDITDEGLDNHLKAEDFFDAANYPTATFEITEISEKEVKGNLTMKGVTNEITFPMAELTITEDSVNVKAEFALDRTLWGINGGLPMVSKFMELSFDITFNKTSE